MHIKFSLSLSMCLCSYLGQQIPLSCGAGLHWSINENRCMHPDDAECPWWDDEIKIEECPEEGLLAIPNIESCERYTLCINGFEVPMTCPTGLHFCRDMRICRHPLVANCIIPSKNVDITKVTATDESTCPKIESADEMVFARHSRKCQSYYLCLRDVSVLFNCAEGLAWNADKKKCMIESKVNCTI